MKQLHSICLSATLATASLGLTATFAPPVRASVVYDVDYFGLDGSFVASGWFTHADTPFEGFLPGCTIDVPESSPFSSSCSRSWEIKASDNYFLVEDIYIPIESKSVLIAGGSGSIDRTVYLFWNPSQEKNLAEYDADQKFSFVRTFREIWSVIPDGLDGSKEGLIDMSSTSNGQGTWRNIAVPGIPPNTNLMGGTWTATRRTSVPETTPIAGLLAVGTLGGLAVAKRRSS